MVPFLQGGSNLTVGYSKRTCKKKGRENQRKTGQSKGRPWEENRNRKVASKWKFKRDGHFPSSGFKGLRILHDGHVAPESISQRQHKDNRETAWR